MVILVGKRIVHEYLSILHLPCIYGVGFCVCVCWGGGGGEGRREYFNCVDFVVWFTVAAELVSKPTFCWDLHFTSDGILDNDAITYHLSLLFA